MIEFLWRVIAWVASRPRVAHWLIVRAHRTPYLHISAAGNPDDIYMGRWWLFNAYGKDSTGRPTAPRWPSLPSIRIHQIMRPDRDRHDHDHPWDARTIILRHGYIESREGRYFDRLPGDTCTLKYGEYHRIVAIPGSEGATTLFFTWRYQGTWGFLVDGRKVPYREYLGLE